MVITSSTQAFEGLLSKYDITSVFVKTFKFIIFVAALLFYPVEIQSASDNQDSIQITVALGGVQGLRLQSDLFAAFEETHPEIRVQIIEVESPRLPLSNVSDEEIEAYLDNMEKYIQAADVLYIPREGLDNIATSAGYLLDISPLIASDTENLDAVFNNAVFDAYKWDEGVWGLPGSIWFSVLSYLPDVFDEGGLSYPSGDWALEDFTNVSRRLTNQTKMPAIPLSSGLLLRIFYGQDFYDSTVVPNVPNFVNNDLITLMEHWQQMQREGISGITTNDSYAMRVVDIPNNQIANPSYAYTLLPGGVAGLKTDGFAISAGTQHPQIAYDIIKYLTGQPDLITGYPARKDVVFTNSFGKQEIYEAALNNLLLPGNLRYAYQIETISSLLAFDTDTGFATSLQAVESMIAHQLDLAKARRSKKFAVETIPDVHLESGEIILKFGISPASIPIPNLDQWGAIADEFVNNDTEVGYVEIESMGFSVAKAPSYDCYYTYGNRIPQLDRDQLLDLAPLLQADPSFDMNSTLPTVFDEVMTELNIWAYPLAVHPLVLWVNRPRFEQVDVRVPIDGWSANEFDDAINQLGPGLILWPETFENGTSIMMLIAAYGGIPYDIRTNPPKLNLRSSDTIIAIQKVLDLGRIGTIRYTKLSFGTGPGPVPMGDGFAIPMFADQYNAYSIRLSQWRTGGGDDYVMVSFPQNSQYNIAAYRTSIGLINKNTPYVQACYRWLTTLSEHPDLFYGLPVQREKFDDLQQSTILGKNVSDFYQALTDQLADPAVVVWSPDNSISIESITEQQWIYRAFDNYVLNDRVLESELALAADTIEVFRECVEGIDPYVAGKTNYQDYFNDVMSCALAVDPSFGN